MSFSQRAVRAYKKSRDKIEEETRKKTWNFLLLQLGVNSDEVANVRIDGDQLAIVEADDGTELHVDIQNKRVAVRGTCPRCGSRTWSEYVESLEGIGRMLVNFVPAAYHTQMCTGEWVGTIGKGANEC